MSTTPDILLRIRDNIRDNGPGVKYDDEIYVRSAVNPTLREMEASGLSSTASGTILSVATQASYTLPTSLRTAYLIEGVFYGAAKIPLHWREHRDNAAFVGGNGTPQFWCQWGSTGKIEVSPAPSASGETIYIEAFASPFYATPTSIADELQLALDNEDCLVAGSSWRMGIIDSEFAKAGHYLQQYKTRIQLIREKLSPDHGDLASLTDVSGYDHLYLDI